PACIRPKPFCAGHSMSSPERAPPPPSSPTASGRCSHCGEAVDPLRAARVRVLDEQFHYFCSPSCAQAYAPVAPRDTRPEADSAALVSTPTAGRAAPANDSCPTEADSHDDSDGSNDGDAKSSVEPDLAVPHREEEVGLHSAPQELAIPVEAEPLTGDGASSAATPARPVALAVAIGSAMLSLLMLLALEGRVTDGLRLAFVGTALAALLGY